MAHDFGSGRTKIVAFLGLIAFVSLAVVITTHLAPSPSVTEEKDAQHSAPQPQTRPPVEDVTIHPYELLKNPFLKKNHVVRLDTHSYPILLDGNLLNYETYTGMPNIISRELVGVRFERMLDEETALFEVLGFNRAGVMSDGGPDQRLTSFGELAVLVPAGSAQLDPEELWSVEPLGTLKGTNGFGASISVPLVRFDGYWRYQQQIPHTTGGRGELAVDLVKTRIKPTKYLMSLEPSFKESKWIPVNDESFSAGSWEVCYYVKILRSDAQSADSVDPCWQVNVDAKTVKIIQKYRGDVPVPDDGSTSRYFETSN